MKKVQGTGRISKDTIRAFIAVELPDELKGNLKMLQDRLKKSEADIRWTRPEGLHLTLRFLGNITEEEKSLVVQAMQEAVRGFKEFEVELKGLGFFPDSNRPRVFWVGICRGGEELEALFQRLEEELKIKGLGEADKPFRAHLTVGRFRSRKNIEELLEYIEKEQNKSCGLFKVRGITLFESELHPEGAFYTALERVDFV